MHRTKLGKGNSKTMTIMALKVDSLCSRQQNYPSIASMAG